MPSDKTGKRPALPPLQTVAGRASASAGSSSSNPLGSRRQERRGRSLSFDRMSGATTSPSSSDFSVPTRRLQKQPPMNSVVDQLSRTSLGSTGSSLRSEDGSPAPTGDHRLLKYGPLKVDYHMFKTSTEYAVLTASMLVKFDNADAAKSVFPQLGGSASRRFSDGTASPMPKPESLKPGKCLGIPLSKVVAVFNEEGSSPNFGIEVWWTDPSPAVSYSHTKFFFGLPRERDDWAAEIRKAIKALPEEQSERNPIPGNVETAIANLVLDAEPDSGTHKLDIYPVVHRVTQSGPRGQAPDAGKKPPDGATYYLAVAMNLCFFVKVGKTTIMKAPYELDMEPSKFGLASLVRFKATMSPREERFLVRFRRPFEHEVQLDLASRFYKEILIRFLKADRYIKPAFPQHLRKQIFDIKGATSPLNLPTGEDHGGVKRTIAAYCISYGVPVPEWKIDWKVTVGYAPQFRLLPSVQGEYTALQLLAVFRALRFNDYFKSLCFRDVDLSALYSKADLEGYDESIADVSRSGRSLSDEHREKLRSSSLLSQEIHAVAFTSGAVLGIDLTNVLATVSKGVNNHPANRTGKYQTAIEDAEILRPILSLLQERACHCDTVVIAQNPLGRLDVEELLEALQSRFVALKNLSLSNCGLSTESLTAIWDRLAWQGPSLEILDVSVNPGYTDQETVTKALRKFRNLKKLNIAYTSINANYIDIFPYDLIMRWRLEELDLSGVVISIRTVQVLCTYLRSDPSRTLRVLTLNHCGLCGNEIADLFKAMGQGRDMTVRINGGSKFEDGLEFLAKAVSWGWGPTILYMESLQFTQETSYILLMKSLAMNRKIRLLSLAGASLPKDLSSAACTAVERLLADNQSIRYLDLSGDSSKLGDSHLGSNFAIGLRGVARNRTLLHLRITDQRLGKTFGELAVAVGQNKKLRSLDLRRNEFGISNFVHFAKALEENKTLRQATLFDGTEFDQAIERSLAPRLSSPPPSTFRNPFSRKPSKKLESRAEYDRGSEELRKQWLDAMERVRSLLERNRLHQEQVLNSQDDDHYWRLAEAAEDTPILAEMFGGLASLERDGLARNNFLSLIQQPIPRPEMEGGLAPSVKRRPAERIGSPDTLSGASPSSPETTTPELESPVDSVSQSYGSLSSWTMPQTPVEGLGNTDVRQTSDDTLTGKAANELEGERAKDTRDSRVLGFGVEGVARENLYD